MAAGGGHWTKSGFVGADDAVGGGGATGGSMSNMSNMTEPELYKHWREGKISNDELRSELGRRHAPQAAAHKEITKRIKAAAAGSEYRITDPKQNGIMYAERKDGVGITAKDAKFFRDKNIKGVSSISYTSNGILFRLNLPVN